MNYQVVDRHYVKKRKVKSAVLITVAVLVVLATAVTLFIHSMTPAIVSLAVADVKTRTLQWINSAVFSVMSVQGNSQLVTVQKDSGGDIALITANTALINDIAQKTASEVQNNVGLLAGSGVKIPLGTATGFPLLTGKGPLLSVDVDPVGRTVCVFRSEFFSQGINQTLHRIILDVSVTVEIVMAGHIETVETAVPVIVSESVIVGNIPSVYLDGITLGQAQSD